MQVTPLHVPHAEIHVTPLLKHVHRLLLHNPLQSQRVSFLISKGTQSSNVVNGSYPRSPLEYPYCFWSLEECCPLCSFFICN